MDRLRRAARRSGPQPIDVDRAGAFDGAHVWITFDAPAPGRITAVETAAGRSVDFTEPVPEGRHTVELDPSELPGTEEASFGLYFSSGGRRRPLRRRRPFDLPTRAPFSPEDPWAYRVATREGVLELCRVRVPAVHPVIHLAQSEDEIEIGWQGRSGSDVLLLDPDETEVARLTPAEAEDRHSVRLSIADMPAGDLNASVVVQHGAESPVPLARRRNDLVRPNAAVLLPAIESSVGTLRLRWARDGTLRVIWRPTG